VERRVGAFDALDGRGDQLGRLHLAPVDELGLGGGVEESQILHPGNSTDARFCGAVGDCHHDALTGGLAGRGRGAGDVVVAERRDRPGAGWTLTDRWESRSPCDNTVPVKGWPASECRASGGQEMLRSGRRLVRVVAALAVVGLVAVGLVATGASAQSASTPGVEAKTVKVGYIYSGTGFAASSFTGASQAFQARIDRANADGGVNGRKIDTELVDDQSSANLTDAQDLIQNRNV